MTTTPSHYRTATRLVHGGVQRSQHGETPRYLLRAAPSPASSTVRLAFGSCFNEFWIPELPIFDSITRENPDAVLLLGDNCYFEDKDLGTEDAMMQAHLRSRNHPRFADMVSRIPTLAIYDDHDFGPNDADGNFEGRDRALSSFKRV